MGWGGPLIRGLQQEQPCPGVETLGSEVQRDLRTGDWRRPGHHSHPDWLKGSTEDGYIWVFVGGAKSLKWRLLGWRVCFMVERWAAFTLKIERGPVPLERLPLPSPYLLISHSDSKVRTLVVHHPLTCTHLCPHVLHMKHILKTL